MIVVSYRHRVFSMKIGYRFFVDAVNFLHFPMRIALMHRQNVIGKDKSHLPFDDGVTGRAGVWR
jgi:hypothetical protein